MSNRYPIKRGERVLHDMLRARGIDPKRPRSIGEVWDVFKEFIAVPFDTDGDDSDGVLFETGGPYSWHRTPAFEIHFARQFEVKYRDGEHKHYEQLHCNFAFPLDDSTSGFGEFNQWWFTGGEPQEWEDFVAVVEGRPEFVALRSVTPQVAEIRQEKV
jgi:hypothetical protein